MARHANRRDENEPVLVEVLELHGYQVRRNPPGFPADLLVWYPGVARWLLLEVKMPGEKLNDLQQEFFDATAGMPREMVTCPEDALIACRKWLTSGKPWWI